MGCAISNQSNSVPGGFILHSQNFCVHQDPLIPLPGFLVIASLMHIRSISEMQASEYDELSRLIRIAHRAIKQATGVENLTIIQEESSSHFHLWFFPWTDGVIEQYGRPNLAKIREIMARIKKQRVGEAEWKELEKTIQEIKTQGEKYAGLDL